MKLTICKAFAACLALPAVVAAIGGCGGTADTDTGTGTSTTVTTVAPGRVVDIYSSLPMQGPSAAEAVSIVKGIKLALVQAGGKAGAFTVRYTSLDDSAGPNGWDADRTAANARKAAADPRTVYYIGELDDDASEVSMPILNEAGIPQVSPTNTYVGLTTDKPGSAAGEPGRYAPTGTRTYLRIVPTDTVQAAADLLAMRQAGCQRVALADDDEPYGAGMLRLVDFQKGYYGVNVVSEAALNPAASNFRSYAATLQAARVDCLLFAGIAARGGVQVARDVHAALPKTRMFAPGPMCTSAWTNARDGGVPTSIDPLIECTAVTRSLTAYPGGRRFLIAYRARYGSGDPSPTALLGYEAMKLGLNTIAGLGPDGDSKSAVLSALFATTHRRSMLGTYGFDRNGDTTLRSVGLYKVGPDGDPAYVRTITPAGAGVL